jgi:hypothetical protein
MQKQGSLADALDGADMFVGVSAAGAVLAFPGTKKNQLNRLFTLSK